MALNVAAGGGGGGEQSGVLGKIIGLALGVAVGALGGSKGGIVAGTEGKGHAAGGSFGPNQFFPVGERGTEMIYTGNQSGVVIPNQAMGGHTINVSFVLPNNMNAQSFGSQPTQHQLAKKLHATISLAVLTG